MPNEIPDNKTAPITNTTPKFYYGTDSTAAAINIRDIWPNFGYIGNQPSLAAATYVVLPEDVNKLKEKYGTTMLALIKIVAILDKMSLTEEQKQLLNEIQIIINKEVLEKLTEKNV